MEPIGGGGFELGRHQPEIPSVEGVPVGSQPNQEATNPYAVPDAEVVAKPTSEKPTQPVEPIIPEKVDNSEEFDPHEPNTVKLEEELNNLMAINKEELE